MLAINKEKICYISGDIEFFPWDSFYCAPCTAIRVLTVQHGSTLVITKQIKRNRTFVLTTLSDIVRAYQD